MTEELKDEGSVPTASQLRGAGGKLTRTLIGKVASDKMDKTIVVLVTRKKKHPIGKYVTRSTKIKAHDELNTCKMGDWVVIQECRPISKEKRWALQSVMTSTGGV